MAKNKELLEEFGYLIEKINSSIFSYEPFEYILIENFLSENHFNQITSAKEINRPVYQNTKSLIDDLTFQNYSPQVFPGCTIDINEYLEAVDSGKWQVDKGLLEGFGMAFRLREYQTPILERITNFLNSKEFKTAIEKKFTIKKSTYVETAIQKYLHAYEISPHPDIRKKAATYMLNINTDPASEKMNIHTYLCKLKPEYNYIYDFWNNYPEMDRCWVPWDWSESIIKTNLNNSIVLFAPSNKSLHAVKLDYNHLAFQRTQIYGNLWYYVSDIKYSPKYKYLMNPSIDVEKIKSDFKKRPKPLRQKVASVLPTNLLVFIKKLQH